YNSGDSGAHIRVENRLLPAGPTPVDMVADAAFYYGLAEFLVGENRPVWSRMSFAEAEENFNACAKDGIEARVTWPKIGRIGVADLVTDVLAPQARRGLARLNIDKDVIDEYMSIIEGRAASRINAATWQLRTLESLAPGSRPDSSERSEGLKAMMDAYLATQISRAPVHTVQVPSQAGRPPGSRPARLGLGLLDCFLRVDPPRSRAGLRSGSTRRRHLGTGAPLSLRRRTSRSEALDFDEDDIVGAVGVRDLVLGSGRSCVADTGLEVGGRRAAAGIAHVHRIGEVGRAHVSTPVT